MARLGNAVKKLSVSGAHCPRTSGVTTSEEPPGESYGGHGKDPSHPRAGGMIRLLGFLAGALTVGSFLPQVVRTWRTKHTRDLSLGMFALLVTSGSLWVVYGLARRDWPVVATNVGVVTLNGILLAAKTRFK
jgi:MtN3 and saliva related transmembrane protein